MQSEIDRQKLLNLKELYKKNLERELGTKVERKESVSLEYTKFKKEFMPPHLNFYEKLCFVSEKVLKIKPDEKNAQEIQGSINIAHLNVTPGGVVSLSYFVPFMIFFLGSLIFFALFRQMFFVFFFLILAVVLVRPLGRSAEFVANNWRLKTSNQMVLAVFYIVTYMRHTANIENAIRFAAEWSST